MCLHSRNGHFSFCLTKWSKTLCQPKAGKPLIVGRFRQPEGPTHAIPFPNLLQSVCLLPSCYCQMALITSKTTFNNDQPRKGKGPRVRDSLKESELFKEQCEGTIQQNYKIFKKLT